MGTGPETGAGQRASEPWPGQFTLRALGSECLEESLEGWEWGVWGLCTLLTWTGEHSPCTCGPSPAPAAPDSPSLPGSPAAVSHTSRELPCSQAWIGSWQ